jgi:hypothetical protein
MSVCIVSGLKTSVHAISFFTLTWLHSVEKTEWQEDWVVENNNLKIIEARIKGSGAGMDPPTGSYLKNGWWVYKPQLKPTNEILLSNSKIETTNWKICYHGKCESIVSNSNIIKVKVCDDKL